MPLGLEQRGRQSSELPRDAVAVVLATCTSGGRVGRIHGMSKLSRGRASSQPPWSNPIASEFLYPCTGCTRDVTRASSRSSSHRDTVVPSPAMLGLVGLSCAVHVYVVVHSKG